MLIENFYIKNKQIKSFGGEMVDTVDSKSTAYKRGGSSPLQGKYSF